MADTFQTQMLSPATAGLNLKVTPDLVPPGQLLVMTNVVGSKQEGGEVQSRPGQRWFATGGTIHHSIGVLTNPQYGDSAPSGNIVKTIWIDEFRTLPHFVIDATDRTRFTCIGFTFPGGTPGGLPPSGAAGNLIFGIDTALYYGIVGALQVSDLGPYSGYPLSFVPYRPSGSSAAWIYIGDSKRMRKVRVDGLSLPIGLPPAGSNAIVELAAEKVTMVEPFNNTGGWGKFAYNGSAVPGNPTSDPNSITGTGLKFTTTPGGATAAYANAWDHGVAVNMDFVGNVVASDSDYISFYLKMNKPEKINDIRIDFGLGGDGDNFYTKHFRPSDFTQVSISGEQPSLVGEDQVAIRQQLDEALNKFTDNREVMEVPKAQRQQANIQSLQAVTGADSWTQFGTYGIVLRRGDFLRRGTDETVGWDDVQSVTITVAVIDNTAVEVSFSNLLLTGGSGPDNGEFGLSEYDYRYIDYDTRTGAKSNPSPVMTVGINSLRRSIIVYPHTYGDSSIRQWFYRRGGTLNDNWYYVGTNGNDGEAFTDNVSDAQAQQGPLLELDNDQPVSTADENGNTVLNQPLYALFGPSQDFLFGCGDPFNPGSVYYCKQGFPDSWPPQNRVEVCAPSEKLQAGCVYGGQPYVFSRERLYALLPNAGALGAVTSIPTECRHGLYARWGLVAGKEGIYFIAYDGIYRTTGGPEEYLTDDIQPLFTGDIRNGYYPIDMTVVEAMRLEIHDNDLWFLYQDTKGVRQCMIYSFIAKYWRHYNFAKPLSCVVHDGTVPRLLLGGFRTGKSYVHEGASDDSAAIVSTISLPYMDQGNPRQNKTYGDVVLDLSRMDTTVSVTAKLDNGLTTLSPVTISSNSQADL